MDYVNSVKEGATALSTPFTNMFTEIASLLPLVLGSIFVLIIGLIVSPILGRAVTHVLQLLKIDSVMSMTGAKNALETIGLRFTLSTLTGTIVKYLVLIVFINISAGILQLEQITSIIESFLGYIPQVIVALVILGIGCIAADWVRNIVTGIANASDNKDYADLLGNSSRICVIVFTIIAALLHLGIGELFISILFAGIVFALSLAFGLGAKSLVEKSLEKWLDTKHYHSNDRM